MLIDYNFKKIVSLASNSTLYEKSYKQKGFLHVFDLFGADASPFSLDFRFLLTRCDMSDTFLGSLEELAPLDDDPCPFEGQSCSRTLLIV